jgi:hypothetical protein
MNHLEVLPKTNISISNEHSHIGGGVLVKVNKSYFILTAAHVIFGDNCCNFQNSNPEELKYISETYGELQYKEYVGQEESIKNHDIVAIHITPSKDMQDFPEVKFCQDTDFPDLEFIFKGRSKSPSGKSYSILPCTKNSEENSDIHIKIPPESYTNFEGETGAEILQGYSGSGVFINNPKEDEIYLIAVVLSVSDDNFTGVNCAGISKFKDNIINEMVISDFFGGNKLLNLNIKDIRRSITTEIINERKTNKYGDVENLTRKMDVFLEDWQPEDLDQFIHDILIWEKIEHSKIRNNSSYKELIDESKAILSSGNKSYQVKNTQEGNDRFHKIQEDFISIVREQLDGTPLQKSSRTIATGEIARLLANCKLDFRK